MQQVEERGAGVAPARTAIRQASRPSSFRVLCALAAGWVLLLHVVATGRGMSVSEDSALYVGAARNLLAGHGLTLPFGTPEPVLLTQFPPFYAALLAAHKLIGLPMLEFARWLNLLFAVVTVLLVIRLSRSLTDGALGTAALAAVLVVSSTRMIAVDAMVMSEPAMICLGTLGLVVLIRFLGPRSGASLTLLLVAAGLAGLAALTRYVGAAYGLTGLIVLVGAVRRRRCRVRTVVIYGVVSLGPLVCFFAYSVLRAARPVNRPFGVHPPAAADLRALIDTFGSWLWSDPGSFGTLVGVVAVGLTVLAVVQLRSSQSADRDGSRDVTSTLGVFAVVYVLAVLASTTFVDASIPGDAPRMLLPVLPVVAVLLTAGLRDAVRRARLSKIAFAALPMVVLIAVVVPHATNSVRWARYARRNGVAVRVREEGRWPLLARIRDTPRAITIYSNDAPLLYLLSGRHVVDVPTDVSSYTRRPVPGFSQELAHMDRELRGGRAELVYLDNGFSPSRERLLELVDLTPVYRSRSATVFVSARCAPRCGGSTVVDPHA